MQTINSNHLWAQYIRRGKKNLPKQIDLFLYRHHLYFIRVIGQSQNIIPRGVLSKAIYNLVAREARWPRAFLAAWELGWPRYICLNISYRSFPVGVCIQCNVTLHMYLRFMVHRCVSFMFCMYSLSVKEIFMLSVNHEQIPSMQMTHKSKHNNSGFKKWMQILAGECSSGATTKRRIYI